jgi:hypothetical protein
MKETNSEFHRCPVVLVGAQEPGRLKIAVAAVTGVQFVGEVGAKPDFDPLDSLQHVPAKAWRVLLDRLYPSTLTLSYPIVITPDSMPDWQIMMTVAPGHRCHPVNLRL